jgi:hypothetical protein
VPLPDGAQCYAIAATTTKESGAARNYLLGDGLVPVRSALGYHSDSRRALPFPESQQWIGYAMNHLDLLDRREVYEQLREWLISE